MEKRNDNVINYGCFSKLGDPLDGFFPFRMPSEPSKKECTMLRNPGMRVDYQCLDSCVYIYIYMCIYSLLLEQK